MYLYKSFKYYINEILSLYASITVMLSLLLLFQVIIRIEYLNIEKKEEQFKNEYVIRGDTRKITEFNLYERLKEKTTYDIIPVVKSTIRVDKQVINIIGTNEKYLEYRMKSKDENSSEHLKKLTIGKAIISKNLLEKFHESNLQLGSQVFEIIDTSGLEDNFIYIMYQDYNLAISKITDQENLSSQIYHFSEIIITGENLNTKEINQVIGNIEDDYNMTFDYYELRIKNGIENSFSKSIYARIIFTFIAFSTLSIYIVIFKRIDTLKIKDQITKRYLGTTRKKIMIEKIVENIIYNLIALSIAYFIVLIIRVIYYLISDANEFVTIDFYYLLKVILVTIAISVFVPIAISNKKYLKKRLT